MRSAREVVELYNLVVWNECNLALAEELFADNVIRHEVGEAYTLSRKQASYALLKLNATNYANASTTSPALRWKI